jgi:hypothetical protein
MKPATYLFCCFAVLGLAAIQARAEFVYSESPRSDFPLRVISFEELADRCIHPLYYPDARGPVSIEIKCQEKQNGWISPDRRNHFSLSWNRIEFSVSSDKFRVDSIAKTYPQLNVCRRGEIKVARERSITQSTSCQGIFAIKANPLAYCEAALNKIHPEHWRIDYQCDDNLEVITCP